MLTDGANTLGVEPLVAAEQAAARHVRVYTIGFGTTEPSQPVCNVDQVGRDIPTTCRSTSAAAAAAAAAGGRRFLQIDEPTLQAVAKMTGGEYFRAADADQLDDVFAGSPAGRDAAAGRDHVWFVLVAALLATGDRPLAGLEPPLSGSSCHRTRPRGTCAVAQKRRRSAAQEHDLRVPRRSGGGWNCALTATSMSPGRASVRRSLEDALVIVSTTDPRVKSG